MMSQLRYFKVAEALLRNGNQRTCMSNMIFSGNRRFYSTAAGNPTKEVATQTAPKGSEMDSQAVLESLKHHRVNQIDKLALVWAGKYKSTAEVPNFVGQDTVERARNKARIKINLMMAAATMLGCMVMIMLGKRAQKQGDSVAKRNEEWHRQVNEEAKMKETAAADGK